MTISPGPCPWHPPRPSKPPPIGYSPWRWHIGGPITDFGDEGDAGPSRICSVAAEGDVGSTASGSGSALSSPPHRPRRRRQRRSALATATAALALFSIPSVAAGPVPVTATLTEMPSPTHVLAPRSIHTEPLYTVSTIPSVPVTQVPESVLPIYFTKSDDGSWHKVDNAWSLYGRVATKGGEQLAPTPPGQSYAIQSQMPPGWGTKSKRKAELYNTPMIVAASVILGILIVFAIIVITYQRRKEARKRKRHARRMRRKALAAAGLTEEGLKDADATLEANFKKHLSELELAHAAKRREKRSEKKQPSAFVRTKVKVWRSTVRRRKSPRTSRDDENHQIKEQYSHSSGEFNGNGNGHHGQVQRSGSPGSLLTRDSASFMTESSRAPSPRRSLSRAGLGSTDPTTTGSETMVDTAPSADSGRSSGDVEGGATSPSPSSSAHDATASSSSSSDAPPRASTSGHMPPAYRPASVRSLNVAGPSSGSRPSPATPAVLSPEKATAAGFYPAPATADAEEAQAVVRRGDAKAPIVVPQEEEERRAMHHVATDDKRELERLRLGASAPPVMRVDDDGAGPSAPNYQVDDEGFETMDSGQADAEAEASSSSAGVSPSLAVPGLPAPPRQTAMRSLRTFAEDDARPSAPPSPGPLSSPSAPSAPPLELSSPPLEPSAPPLDEPSAPPSASAPPLDDFEDAAPSAPPLDDEEEERGEEGSAPASPRRSGASGGANEGAGDLPSPEADADADDVMASLNVGGHRFLPRYEP